MRWTQVYLDGPHKVNHCAVCLNNYVYSFGGFCSTSKYLTDETHPIEVYAFDTIRLLWRKVQIVDSLLNVDYSNTPYNRYGQSAVAYGGKAYIWGGQNDSTGVCETLFKFDPVTERFTAVTLCGRYVPGGRDGHTACVLNDSMYVFGGYISNDMVLDNELNRFDFLTSQWTLVRVLSEKPQWRDFATLTAIGAKLYLYGGRGSSLGPVHDTTDIYFSEICVFDPSLAKWEVDLPRSQVEPRGLPSSRRSHAAFTHNGCLYVFGGYRGRWNMHLNDLWCYDPQDKLWTRCVSHGQSPSPRRRMMAVAIDDDRVLIFGGTQPVRKQSLLQIDDHGDPERVGLEDLSDAYILDFNPSLQVICLFSILTYRLDYSSLPRDLQRDLSSITPGFQAVYRYRFSDENSLQQHSLSRTA